MKHNDEIEFVARHYRRGAFSTKAAMMRMGLRRRNRWAVAASVAVTVALTASAALFIRHEYSLTEQVAATEEVVEPVAVSKVLDFEGASLPTVISEIETTYGVKIGGVPENAGDMKLTLHYEGDIDSLITTINDILGTSLYIIQ